MGEMCSRRPRSQASCATLPFVRNAFWFFFGFRPEPRAVVEEALRS